jgi:hypothetical protein
MGAEREQLGGRLPTRMTVLELFLLFLEEVQATRDEDTFLDYQRWCSEFTKVYGDKPARSITKADAADFKLVVLTRRLYRRTRSVPRNHPQ